MNAQSNHPINDTREASQLSDPSPHRGALQPALRRPEVERNALGVTHGALRSRAVLNCTANYTCH